MRFEYMHYNVPLGSSAFSEDFIVTNAHTRERFLPSASYVSEKHRNTS
jgi:hypothetical protein